jgi:hypothetical protein
MTRMQNYYGEYQNKSVADFLFKYLQQEIDENKLITLSRYVMYSHPAKFGPPSIAEVEKAITEALRLKRGTTDCRKIIPTPIDHTDPRVVRETQDSLEKIFQGKPIMEHVKLQAKKNKLKLQKPIDKKSEWE